MAKKKKEVTIESLMKTLKQRNTQIKNLKEKVEILEKGKPFPVHEMK